MREVDEPASAEHAILDTPEAGRRIVRGGVLRVAGYVAGSLLSVIGAALLTRHLGVADFGRYSAVFSLMTILLGLTDSGTVALGVREHALRDREGGRRFLGALLGLRLVMGVAGVAVGLLVCVIAGYDGQMVLGALLAGVGLVVFIVWGTVQVPLQSMLRLGWVTALELVRQVATVALLVAGVLVGAGIAPLLGITLPVGVLLLVVTWPVVRGRATLRPTWRAAEWRPLLAVTLPFATAAAVGIVYAHISVLLMSVASTERETGLFGAAFRVYFVMASVPGLLVSTALPVLARAARDDRERLHYAVQRLFEACLVAGAGVALLTALGAPAIIEVVAGSGYDGSVGALRIMSLAMLGTFLIALGSYGLLSTHRYRALLLANAAGLMLSAGLTLALAPSHGARGAAIAVASGDLFLAVVQLVALGRAGGVRVGLRNVPLVAMAAALGAGLALLTGLPSVPAAAIGVAVFAAAAMLSGAVPREVLVALRRGPVA
ncbi:MAG: oligosaccharide flippase family protein [Solirubrobacteraceae bacterium]